MGGQVDQELPIDALRNEQQRWHLVMSGCITQTEKPLVSERIPVFGRIRRFGAFVSLREVETQVDIFGVSIKNAILKLGGKVEKSGCGHGSGRYRFRGAGRRQRLVHEHPCHALYGTRLVSGLDQGDSMFGRSRDDDEFKAFVCAQTGAFHVTRKRW